MEFQVRLPIAGPLASHKAVLRVARTAESLGYGAVQAADRLVWTTGQNKLYFIGQGSAEVVSKDPTPTVYDPIVTLSYVAGATNSIRLVTSAIVLPFRNPVVFAKETSTLDVLSDGRLVLGLGVGGGEFGKYVANILRINFQRRGEIADEYIRAINEIWSNSKSTFHGKFVDFEEAEVFPKPIQKPGPPIWIAGDTQRALRRVAELGEGWHPTYTTAEEIESGIKTIRTLAANYGRARRKFEVGPTLFTCISSADSKAEALVKKTMEVLSRGYVYPERFRKLQETLKRNLVGSPSRITKLVEEYRRAGSTYVGLKFIYRTIEEFLESLQLFQREVASRF